MSEQLKRYGPDQTPQGEWDYSDRADRIIRALQEKLKVAEERSLPYSAETIYMRKDIHEERIAEKNKLIVLQRDALNQEVDRIKRIKELESDHVKAVFAAEREFNMWTEKLDAAGEEIADLKAEVERLKQKPFNPMTIIMD